MVTSAGRENQKCYLLMAEYADSRAHTRTHSGAHTHVHALRCTHSRAHNRIDVFSSGLTSHLPSFLSSSSFCRPPLLSPLSSLHILLILLLLFLPTGRCIISVVHWGGPLGAPVRGPGRLKLERARFS